MRAEVSKNRARPPVGRMLLFGVAAATLIGLLGLQVWSAVNLARYGRVDLGVDFRASDWRELAKIWRDGGYHVHGVLWGRPFFRAGVRTGDLVLEVNGRRVAEHPDAWYGPHLWGKPGDTLNVIYVRGGDREAAMEQARALERISAYEGARAWAQVWEAAEDSIRAVEALRRAAVLDTSAAQQAGHDLGTMLNRLSRSHEAYPVYMMILHRRPEDRMALYLLGESLLWSEADLDSAAGCFKRYMKSPPGSGQPSLAWAHHRLGEVYSKQRKRAAAVAELRQAVELEPFNWQFAHRLAEEEKGN